MKKIGLVAFIVIFFTTAYVRFSAVSHNNFPITYDQGRDLIDIRSIVDGHKLRLIGPTTSINGVYLGPFWYYFNAIPYALSHGDPASLMSWQIIWYQLIGIFLYLVIRKTDHNLAFFVSVIYLLMPLGFNTSRYFWNANAMPIFTALFLLALYNFHRNKNIFGAFLIGLSAGIGLQIEAAFGIIFFPFSFLYLLAQSRKLKVHLAHFIGFGVTLLPQMVFEIRHQFPLSKMFLSELSGKSSMLGSQLSFTDRLLDRKENFAKIFVQISHISPNWLYIIFAVGLLTMVVLIAKKFVAKNDTTFFLINLSFLLFAAVFYILFSKELKGWYLLGISIPLVFIFAYILSTLFSRKNLFLKIAVILILFVSIFSTYQAQSQFLTETQSMGRNNKSNLNNALLITDWVYQHADGLGFKVYSYLPAIYDYSYQYIFWWYGNKTYHYRPNDISYLPNQPEYIENMRSYFTGTRSIPDNQPTFLIIEKEESNPTFQEAWLGNFSKLCQIDSYKFDFGVEIRKMVICTKK